MNSEATRLLPGLAHRMVWIVDSGGFIPIVIGLGLVLRLVMLIFFPTGYFSDAGWYAERAVELANGQGFQEDGYPTAFWAVGWPAILAAVYKVTGSVRLSHDLLNFSAVAVTFYLLLWLGRRVVCNERTARIAVLIYAFYPAHIAYTGMAFTETFYAGLFCWRFVCL